MNLELSTTDQKAEEILEELQDLLHAWANTHHDLPNVHKAINDFDELYNLVVPVTEAIISDCDS